MTTQTMPWKLTDRVYGLEPVEGQDKLKPVIETRIREVLSDPFTPRSPNLSEFQVNSLVTRLMAKLMPVLEAEIASKSAPKGIQEHPWFLSLSEEGVLLLWHKEPDGSVTLLYEGEGKINQAQDGKDLQC